MEIYVGKGHQKLQSYDGGEKDRSQPVNSNGRYSDIQRRITVKYDDQLCYVKRRS